VNPGPKILEQVSKLCAMPLAICNLVEAMETGLAEEIENCPSDM
jgi:hypothetical protein